MKATKRIFSRSLDTWKNGSYLVVYSDRQFAQYMNGDCLGWADTSKLPSLVNYVEIDPKTKTIIPFVPSAAV